MSKNFYDILGVDTDASERKIKSAYRRLVMTCHPDKVPGEEAAAKFAELQLAYDTLMDPQERAYYDRNGKIKGKGPSREDIDRFIVVCFEELLSSQGNVGLDADPFGWIVKNLGRKLVSERDRIPRAEYEIRLQERLKSRLIFKGEGVNPLAAIFQKKIDEQKDIITNAGVAIDLIEATIPVVQAEFDYMKPDPSRHEGSLYLPGSGRPRTAEDIGRGRPRIPGDYSQEELQRMHDRGGFYR